MSKFKPSSKELEEAQEIADKGIDRASEHLTKSEELEVGFGWTAEPFVLENMSGVAGKSYGSNYIYIQFNTETEGWKDSLLATSVHEYGHAWFYENIENQYAKVLWRYIIDEALTQNLAKKLVPEFESPWRKKHSAEKISEYWSEIKDELEREVNHPDPLYVNKSEEGYPNWLGYSMSYLIGQELLQENDLKEFPDLDKNDVIRIGNQIFGDN